MYEWNKVKREKDWRLKTDKETLKYRLLSKAEDGILLGLTSSDCI